MAYCLKHNPPVEQYREACKMCQADKRIAELQGKVDYADEALRQSRARIAELEYDLKKARGACQLMKQSADTRKAALDEQRKIVLEYNTRAEQMNDLFRTSPRPHSCPKGLRLLAKWFDQYDALTEGEKDKAVQKDLLRWADEVEKAQKELADMDAFVKKVAQHYR